jgi:hypothetical protein
MKTNRTAPHFKTLELADVPRSRNGKHKVIVAAILRDLDQLGVTAAFRVPLAELGDSKENVPTLRRPRTKTFFTFGMLRLLRQQTGHSARRR